MHVVESVWQQSVALSNELWEQKLINNFNYSFYWRALYIVTSVRYCRTLDNMTSFQQTAGECPILWIL